MRRYRSRGECVIDELGDEVCRCKDDATAQKIADALTHDETPGLGSVMIRPHRMVGVSVEWPNAPLVDEPAVEDDPIADLLVAGEEVKRELCERAGGTLSELEVGKRLGISHEEVARRRCGGKLLAVMVDHEFRYPVCQFVSDGLAAGVAEILEIMGAEPWTALEFMITSIPDLEGDTGLQAFASPDPAKRGLAQRAAQIAAGEEMG